MTQYNVYGIGNALVDIEFEVKPEILEDLSIDKGVMTLIDEDRQHQILDRLKEFPAKRGCGGSAANTMIAISQLGGRSFYSCKVANDEAGTFYLEDMLACGVSTNLKLQTREDGVTGKCLVLVTPDADRTMTTYLGITAHFSAQELVAEVIPEAEYLYIEGYLVTGAEAKAAAIRAREIAQQAHKKVAMSLSDFNMTKFFKDGLLEIMGPGVDFIFANESEALEMAGTTDLTQALDHLKTLTKQFAVTQGSQGSLIFDGESLISVDAVKVEAVDTVGAGDMYAGAFLYGITHGMSYPQAGKLASNAAAKLVTSLGPRLKTDDLQTVLQSCV